MLSHNEVKSISLPKIVRNDMAFPSQFESINDAFKDYKTAISETIETNLSLLDEVPLPRNLSRDDLREFFKKDIESDLKQDPLFEKAVEIGRYSKNMLDKMGSYFKEIFGFHEKLKQGLYSEIFYVSKMFLNSNLPLSFAKAIKDSTLVEKDYVDIFDREIRREQRDLLRNRSNKPKFEKVCDSHNAWIKAFQETQRKIGRERTKLIWYVDFNNSTTLDEVFKPKFIRTNLLDKAILQDFTCSLQKHAQEMERLNTSRTEFHPFSPSETSSEARTILEIMQIINR